MKTVLRTAVLLAAMACARCAGSPAAPASPAPAASTTFLTINSAPGDLVGQGASYHYGLSDGSWWAGVDSSGTPNQITVRVANFNEGWWWSMDLAAPAGEALSVGTYDAARRSPFQPTGTPGMNFSGSGRTCVALTGRFRITEIAFAADNTIDRLHATFEQRCDGAPASLTGEVAVAANPWR